MVMLPELIETRAHTTRDGMLNLSVNVGVAMPELERAPQGQFEERLPLG